MNRDDNPRAETEAGSENINLLLGNKVGTLYFCFIIVGLV